ncbi:hypothetical protein SAMN05421761_105136 [Belliella pelovolcani]|uniref:Uncharacterized protein n=1 Tax=Belliella pelovolcani TaxID=529505 RepID=A0A1N7M6C2_9BACT|nr:hypothetical protein SAMN05421761_105136 [Belliella pelovolcani]
MQIESLTFNLHIIYLFLMQIESQNEKERS